MKVGPTPGVVFREFSEEDKLGNCVLVQGFDYKNKVWIGRLTNIICVCHVTMIVNWWGFVSPQQQQKLQDQVLQELNEQLQMNILQQSQLMQQQPDKSKMGKSQLQQLAVQQQQLVQQIQQIQIQQRQYLLACLVQPFGVPQGELRPFILLVCHSPRVSYVPLKFIFYLVTAPGRVTTFNIFLFSH